MTTVYLQLKLIFHDATRVLWFLQCLHLLCLVTFEDEICRGMKSLPHRVTQVALHGRYIDDLLSNSPFVVCLGLSQFFDKTPLKA